VLIGADKGSLFHGCTFKNCEVVTREKNRQRALHASVKVVLKLGRDGNALIRLAQ